VQANFLLAAGPVWDSGLRVADQGQRSDLPAGEAVH